MESKFLLNNGDPKWLKGIEFAPLKLMALSTLNKLLAHRPWLVTGDHIKVIEVLRLRQCVLRLSVATVLVGVILFMKKIPKKVPKKERGLFLKINFHFRGSRDRYLPQMTLCFSRVSVGGSCSSMHR